MSVWCVTGKLGGGKSLVSVGRIFDYLSKGRPVATNMDLHLDKLFHPRSRKTHIRLPDFPNVNDFNAIGKGNEEYDEAKNGLIVLDECGVFFNSRDWQTPERQEVIKWLLHSRKLGWDVILIVQDITLLDKQIRLALCEHVVIVKRLDRIGIPVIGFLFNLIGAKLRFPRFHIGSVRYGLEQHALITDRWFYRGTLIQHGYDTKQRFSALTSPALHSVLSPWHTVGRYLPPTFLQEVIAWLRGDVLKRVNPVPLRTKSKLACRLMKLPPEQRLVFFKRFQACGAI